jgi:hypothetical protein
VGLVPKRGCLLTLAYYALPWWYEFGERRWKDILTGENRRTRRKTCPSATLSTTNLTWIDPDSNPGLRGERSATNDLSHGTAVHPYSWVYSLLPEPQSLLSPQLQLKHIFSQKANLCKLLGLTLLVLYFTLGHHSLMATVITRPYYCSVGLYPIQHLRFQLSFSEGLPTGPQWCVGPIRVCSAVPFLVQI